MSGILLPIVVFLLIGGLASAWLLGVRLRREQQATGIMALAGMHWREFQRLVLEVMARRGYRQAGSTDMSDDHGLIELEHGGRMSLLSTKHGTAYVLGPATIAEFASDLQLRGATGGWMTTLGNVTADTRSLARVQKIELLDGHTLWAEIEPQLDPAQRAEIMGAVRARANRHVLLAWVLAAVAGIAMFLLPGRDAPAPEPGALDVGGGHANECAVSAEHRDVLAAEELVFRVPAFHVEKLAVQLPDLLPVSLLESAGWPDDGFHLVILVHG